MQYFLAFAARCEKGKTEVIRPFFVKLSCIETGKAEPVACVLSNGREILKGHTIRDDHFRYICAPHGETLQFYATGK